MVAIHRRNPFASPGAYHMCIVSALVSSLSSNSSSKYDRSDPHYEFLRRLVQKGLFSQNGAVLVSCYVLYLAICGEA